jgi:hypothetical protein
MLNNKWRKLKIKENNNNSLKEEEKNDEKEKKEIIIVNMDNISESDIEKEENEEIEKEEEIEEKENKNETKSEKNFKNTNSKYLKAKPKPIINVDPSAVRITNYKVDIGQNQIVIIMITIIFRILLINIIQKCQTIIKMKI